MMRQYTAVPMIVSHCAVYVGAGKSDQNPLLPVLFVFSHFCPLEMLLGGSSPALSGHSGLYTPIMSGPVAVSVVR